MNILNQEKEMKKFQMYLLIYLKMPSKKLLQDLEGAKDLFGQVAGAAKRMADDIMGGAKR